MSDKVIIIGDQQHELDVERDGSEFRAGKLAIEVVAVRDREAEIRAHGRTHFVPFVIQGTQVSFAFDGEIYTAEVTEKGARTRARHRDHSMSAPMPGVVLKILVQVGAEVAKGAPLIILEAMKMEHTIAAPRDGTVAAINCREGELVQPGVELVTLQ
jgi:3-methylcrotonyl-CoA carboxylase alpha subunit